jgi:hypothetical protein
MAYRAKIPEGHYTVFISEYIEVLSYGSYFNRSKRQREWAEPRKHWLLGLNIIMANEDGEIVAKPSSRSHEYSFYDLNPNAMMSQIVINNPTALIMVEDPIPSIVGRFAEIEFKAYWRLGTLTLIPESKVLASHREATNGINTRIERIKDEQ